MTMLRKIASFLLEWSRFPANLAKLWSFMNDPRILPYTGDPANTRSRALAWLDQIVWLIRHREVNEFYYLYRLDGRDRADLSSYIGYEEFRKLRDRINFNRHLAASRNYSILLRDKFVFNKYMESIALPVPPTIALIERGSVRWAGECGPAPLSSLYDPHRPDFSSYCKYVYGECGEKIFRMIKQGDIVTLDDRRMTENELATALDGVFFVQREVRQHPELDSFYPLTTNTLRLYTVMTRRGPELFYGIMRFGANGNRVDNWAIGGIIIKVDITTGELATEGYFKPEYGGVVTAHPATGRPFAGYRPPFFSESAALAKETHQFFHGIRHIGWDIAITADGPVIIEGNDNWEISVMQALDRRGWKQWMYENSSPEPR
ncbi:MAG TPA: sugar-transfer associated ATP-grasp domain-containing protein [bacterium]|nr:sugar-transfer associated ATP-grasp domain-containing protein [bacterium]